MKAKNFYKKPEYGINEYECVCLGKISDGFDTESKAWEWMLCQALNMLDKYVDWDNPDDNMLPFCKIMDGKPL